MGLAGDIRDYWQLCIVLPLLNVKPGVPFSCAYETSFALYSCNTSSLDLTGLRLVPSPLPRGLLTSFTFVAGVHSSQVSTANFTFIYISSALRSTSHFPLCRYTNQLLMYPKNSQHLPHLNMHHCTLLVSCFKSVQRNPRLVCVGPWTAQLGSSIQSRSVPSD